MMNKESLGNAVRLTNDTAGDASDEVAQAASNPWERLMETMADHRRDEPLPSLEDVQRRYEQLGPRERETFVGMVNDLSVKHSARQLGIAPKTVEYYRRLVLSKMQVRDSRELRRLVLGAR
jgi:FixJ family two-component response regulator